MQNGTDGTQQVSNVLFTPFFSKVGRCFELLPQSIISIYPALMTELPGETKKGATVCTPLIKAALAVCA